MFFVIFRATVFSVY